jgi:hypothetical protein
LFSALAIGSSLLAGLTASPVFAQAVAGNTGTTATTGTTGTNGTTGTTPCAGGILVDPEGVVRPMFHVERAGKLDKKRKQELAGKSLPGDLNDKSPLRKISLVQLEAACEEFARNKTHVTSEMQFLAGLQRIDYVFVYPQEKDIVIAGPAEGYLVDNFGRAVGVTSGRPALRLDDLIVALRTQERGGGTIRCSIDPTEASLAKLSAYVRQNSGGSDIDTAKARFDQLGDVLGMQNVSLTGVPAESHFAELLVEADIRMKRLAIGVDKAKIKNFRSHLAMVAPGGNSVQRWWFTPLYNAFTKSEDNLAFQFAGQRVQLLSQEELISDAGKRTDAPFTRVSTEKFSKQFTDRYADLADATPVFAELQSIFDLAVLAALIKKESLSRRAQWPMALFLDTERATIVKQNVPHQVPSVSNYRVVQGQTFVAQVSGGVVIDPWQVLKHNEYRKDSGGQLKSARDEAVPEKSPEDHRWWWD